MICQECCQLKTNSIKCRCEGADLSTKYLGCVDGCVIFEGLTRCKNETTVNLVCSKHNLKHTDEDLGFIRKLFEK
jgi:hypothetical protein